MHFVTLMKFELEPQAPDKKTDAEILAKIEELKQAAEDKDSWLRSFHIERLTSYLTPFSRAVSRRVDDLMEPYNQNTEDPAYLEFDDRTDELTQKYEEGTPDCIKLPEGTILEADDYRFRGKFVIKDGKVFQCKAGQLKHDLRTKKAKKIKPLLNFPRKKVYKSLEQYAVEYEGYQKGSKDGTYGWWINPQGYWDWYSVGGRWPKMFLVRKDCEEFTYGERSPSEEQAPEGYIWVCGARKKDIAWEEMRNWYLKIYTQYYHEYVKVFESGESPDKSIRITEDGVCSWGELLYKKGESLDDFLARQNYLAGERYPVVAHDLVSEDEWFSQYELEWDVEKGESDKKEKWKLKIEEFIDDMDDDDVIVVVDYHS